MEPPRAVHVGQVLLEDAVLQHVLGHSLATVDQTPESAENITELNEGQSCGSESGLVLVGWIQEGKNYPQT
jgi:hypothetical protein